MWGQICTAYMSSIRATIAIMEGSFDAPSSWLSNELFIVSFGGNMFPQTLVEDARCRWCIMERLSSRFTPLAFQVVWGFPP